MKRPYPFDIDTLTTAEKLQLVEALFRSPCLSVAEHSPDDSRAALAELRAQLSILPVMNPEDGWSNRDHDALLYGKGS